LTFGIAIFRYYTFEYYSFDVSWLVPTNGDETTHCPAIAQITLSSVIAADGCRALWIETV